MVGSRLHCGPAKFPPCVLVSQLWAFVTQPRKPTLFDVVSLTVTVRVDFFFFFGLPELSQWLPPRGGHRSQTPALAQQQQRARSHTPQLVVHSPFLGKTAHTHTSPHCLGCLLPGTGCSQQAGGLVTSSDRHVQIDELGTGGLRAGRTPCWSR